VSAPGNGPAGWRGKARSNRVGCAAQLRRLLAWAIVHQTAHPWLSLVAGVAALVALRGCPMCWTVGLVETLSQGRRDSTIRSLLACVSRRLDVGAGAARSMKMGNTASP